MLTLAELQLLAGAETVLALCDDDGDGNADAGVVEAAAAGAAAELSAQLAPVIASPNFAATPLLRDLLATRTILRLFERRRERPAAPWRERALRADAIVAEIVAGRHPLSPTIAQSRAAENESLKLL